MDRGKDISKTMYFNSYHNHLVNEYGKVIYDLWTYFWPSQIYYFKKNVKTHQSTMTKQGRMVILVQLIQEEEKLCSPIKNRKLSTLKIPYED